MINDIDIIFNTADSGIIEYTTKEIIGFLEAFIIQTEKPIEIIIKFDEQEITLLSLRQFAGIKYIPLRIQALSYELEGFNYSQEKWALNNKLKIIIKGEKQTKIFLSIRFTNDNRITKPANRK